MLYWLRFIGGWGHDLLSNVCFQPNVWDIMLIGYSYGNWIKAAGRATASTPKWGRENVFVSTLCQHHNQSLLFYQTSVTYVNSIQLRIHQWDEQSVFLANKSYLIIVNIYLISWLLTPRSAVLVENTAFNKKQSWC